MNKLKRQDIPINPDAKLNITPGKGPEADDPVKTAEQVDAINAMNKRRGLRPLNGSMCLACCGCFGVMQTDGSLLFWNPTVGQPNAACFASEKELNDFARAKGWMATDDGNHRCPDCYREWREREIVKGAESKERVGCVIPANMILGNGRGL